MGYHKVHITKGILGEYTKIKEEFDELTDAVGQKNKILIICELSDLLGAIEEYGKQFSMTLADLKDFSDLTKAAFKDGSR
jgi:phosphoribosyl-ATP pyrophosphohydrolase